MAIRRYEASENGSRLTMVSIMMILCSQIRGIKNHKMPTASAMIIEGISGIQKTCTMKTPHENMKAKNARNRTLSAESGMANNTAASISTTAKK